MTLRRDAFPASPVNARLSWALRLALLLQCSPVSSFEKDASSALFFYKSIPKKVKRQINGKFSNDYYNLKEQSHWLEKLIRLIKCDTDDRVIQLYSIMVEADDYHRTCKLLIEKNRFSKKITKKNLLESEPIKPDEMKVSTNNLSEDQTEIPRLLVTPNKDNDVDEKVNLSKNIITKEEIINDKSVHENITNDMTQAGSSNKIDIISNKFLQDYEKWNIELEHWKDEKNIKIYKIFHLIESSDMSELNDIGKACLRFLSLYEDAFIKKNRACK
jgi:hypothetical protein